MATIERYQTGSGATLYMVRYRKPDHRQTKKRGFRTKRDAEAFASTVEVQKLTGEYIEPKLGKITVTEVAEAWLRRQVHVKPSWSTRQESLWRVHVQPKWGLRQVVSISRPEIRDWIASIKRAPSTVADIHGVLAAILDEAVDERRIPANPARGVALPRRELSEHNYLSHEQVHQLADEVSAHDEIVMLLAYSGLRWGEMAALRPRDLDTAGNRIHIVRSASKVNSRSVIVAPKTWERRVVAVPAEVMALIEPLARGVDSDGLIWSRPNGTPLRPPTTTHWFSKAVERLVDEHTPRDEDEQPTGPSTWPRITAHELRHTAASLMIAAGAHVKTVQRQLGHKSATMTLDQYGHLFEDDLDNVADLMGDGLRSARLAAKCAQNVPTAPDFRVVD